MGRLCQRRTRVTDFNRCAQMDNQRPSDYLRVLRRLSEGQGAAFAIRSYSDGTLTQRVVLCRQHQVSLGWSRTLSLQPALAQREVLFRRNQVSPGRSRTLSLHPAPTRSEALAGGELSENRKLKGKLTLSPSVLAHLPFLCTCVYEHYFHHFHKSQV